MHGVASGYAVLVASAVFALVSWPMAMHYLADTRRFGLWGLMANIAAYLNLIDVAMAGSIARLLVDHKDDPGGGTYGSLIKTGWLVLATQAAIILAVGVLAAPLLCNLLKIEPDLSG